MIQEIITYLIIGGAVVLALLKIAKCFKKKPASGKTANSQVKKVPSMHNCSNCSASCGLRNTAKHVVDNNFEICGMIEPKKL